MLLKLLIALVTLHIAFGFVELAAAYYAGDIADHGAAGWVSRTPIGEFIDLDSTEQQTNPNSSLFDVRQPARMFDVVLRAGGAINGLASFNYPSLALIQPDDGFVYNIVMLFRILSALIWIALGLGMLYLLFQSNLLTSKFGMAMVALGLSVGSLSFLDAFFGG